MEITHEWENGPEILHAEVDGDASLYEVKLLEPILEEPTGTGTAVDREGTILKDNKGVYIDKVHLPIYAKCSPTAKIMDEFINSAKENIYTPNSMLTYLYTMQGYNILFSAYKDGDYYKPHRDECKLTVLFWFGEKNFDGGDLYLPAFDYTIPYGPNKIFMFPSCYAHEVTPISTDQKGFVRYCASAFIN